MDLHRHVDYIHYNPVKHGWVSHTVDWPYSSFHSYLNAGMLSPNWTASDEIRELSME